RPAQPSDVSIRCSARAACIINSSLPCGRIACGRSWKGSVNSSSNNQLLPIFMASSEMRGILSIMRSFRVTCRQSRDVKIAGSSTPAKGRTQCYDVVRQPLRHCDPLARQRETTRAGEIDDIWRWRRSAYEFACLDLQSGFHLHPFTNKYLGSETTAFCT